MAGDRLSSIDGEVDAFAIRLPDEDDGIAIDAWDGIHEGNIADLSTIVPNFAKHFAAHIYTAKKMALEAMTGQQLKASSVAARNTTPGRIL